MNIYAFGYSSSAKMIRYGQSWKAFSGLSFIIWFLYHISNYILIIFKLSKIVENSQKNISVYRVLASQSHNSLVSALH